MVFATLAAAQEPGGRAPDQDVVKLQAQASREIDNDQLIAVLAVEVEGADPVALGAEVNVRMAAALRVARELPSVQVRTGNYRTFPHYRDQRIDSWQVSQELRLESSDFVAATRLIGRLQQDLVVRGMSVRLSPEARRAAENALIAEAIAAFQERAELVRKSMKAAGYQVRTLNIAVEPGTSQVVVTASGTIQLR